MNTDSPQGIGPESAQERIAPMLGPFEYIGPRGQAIPVPADGQAMRAYRKRRHRPALRHRSESVWPRREHDIGRAEVAEQPGVAVLAGTRPDGCHSVEVGLYGGRTDGDAIAAAGVDRHGVAQGMEAGMAAKCHCQTLQPSGYAFCRLRRVRPVGIAVADVMVEERAF